MNDTVEILGCIILAFILEYFKYEFGLSIINILFFINISGLYFIIKRMKITIKIEYNLEND